MFASPLVAKFYKTHNSSQFFVIENVGLNTNSTQITQALQKQSILNFYHSRGYCATIVLNFLYLLTPLVEFDQIFFEVCVIVRVILQKGYQACCLRK